MNHTIAPITDRTKQVVAAFGLHRSRRAKESINGSIAPRDIISSQVAAPTLRLLPGTITLITGPSGAGKSSLLLQLKLAHANRNWLDLTTIPLEQSAVVDQFADEPLTNTLRRLARVGLAEAWTYLRTPAQLSDGQRWRLRIAMALAMLPGDNERYPGDPTSSNPHESPIFACDEFAAVLDRITARIVAHALRRSITASGRVSAVVATSHDDLIGALKPDCIVYCDFGRVRVEEVGTMNDSVRGLGVSPERASGAADRRKCSGKMPKPREGNTYSPA